LRWQETCIPNSASRDTKMCAAARSAHAALTWLSHIERDEGARSCTSSSAQEQWQSTLMRHRSAETPLPQARRTHLLCTLMALAPKIVLNFKGRVQHACWFAAYLGCQPDTLDQAKTGCNGGNRPAALLCCASKTPVRVVSDLPGRVSFAHRSVNLQQVTVTVPVTVC